MSETEKSPPTKATGATQRPATGSTARPAPVSAPTTPTLRPGGIPGNVLRIGVADAVSNVDPRSMAEMTTILLARQVFEGPYEATPQGTAAPRLFTSALEPVAGSNGTQYLADPARDARFSDGSPCAPEDIVAALQNDPTFSSRASAELKDGRVLLTLKEPNARFDLFLTICGLVYKETPGGLVGTGPYRIDGATSGELVKLVANPHGRVKPPIPTVEVRQYPASATGRPEALLAALEKGEADLAPRLSWRDIQGLKSTAAIMRPVNSTCMLYINCDRFPDARVRRAIALALDRQEIAAVAFGDNPLAFRATGLLPPALGKSYDGLAPDPEKARALLQEAGVTPGTLKLAYSPGARPYLPAPAAVARHIRDRLRRIGVTVEPDELAAAGALTRSINAGEFDLALMGNIPDNPDPADFMSTVIGSDAIPDSADGRSFCFNFSRYRNAAVDAEIARYRRDQDVEILSGIGRTIGQDCPLVPLLYGRACVAHSWRLKGWEASVTGLADLTKLSFR